MHKQNLIKKFFKNTLTIVLTLLVCFSFSGCLNNTDKNDTDITNNSTSNSDSAEKPDTKDSIHTEQQSHKIKFTMKDGGEFVIETHPEYAPETCANFVNLVNEGFYDGLTFHRVLDDFVAQGGDPKGNGTGGSGKHIKGEFAQNGFEQNTLSHTRGVVSMARSQSPDSASSQFFICYSDQTQLDGSYAAFGIVTEGMETVDAFLNVERDKSGMPKTPIEILKAEVTE